MPPAIDDPADPAFPDPDGRLVLEAGCDRCPALAASRTRIAWGVGPRDADVVVVGEAPAAGDPNAPTWQGGNHTGMAYTSRHSGRKIRQLFADLGYADRTYYTNAVKCFPREGVRDGAPEIDTRDPTATDDGSSESSPSNREPTPEEAARCRGHLLAKLDRVAPDVVVPTGRHATASLLAAEGRTLDGFLETVLDPIHLDSLGVTAVAILHPSYQDVWLARLGSDPAEYRAALSALLP